MSQNVCNQFTCCLLYTLYVQSQICFADLLHGWPSTVGDDIHFLATKELNFADACY